MSFPGTGRGIPTISELPEGLYKDIANEIGMENLLKLARLCGGGAIYMPRPESLFRSARDEAIRAEYNGGNLAQLARKYGISTRWAHQIIHYPVLSKTED